MRLVLAAASLALLSACATGPKPCTVEWIDARKNAVYDRFIENNQEEITSLIQIGLRLSQSEKPELSQAVEVAAALLKVGGLVSEFADEAVPEINSAIGRCGTGPGADRLFADLLRRQGVDEKTVNDIERLGLLKALRS